MNERITFMIDKNFCVLSWGEEIGRIAGTASSSALGKPYHAVFPRLLSGRKDAVLLALKRKKEVILKNYFLKCPEPLTADITIDPMEDGTSAAVRVTVSHVQCPLLRESQKAPGETARIASILAHGVRNPLNAMKGAVAYLGQKYGAERNLPEFARIMEDEIAKFDNFISKFLSSATVSSDAQLTDINEVLERIRILTSFQTESCGILVSFSKGKLPAVKANAFHLEHAILNVINNAIGAMPTGGSLSVKTRTEKRGPGFAVVDILDTGPGIAKGQTLGTAENAAGKGFGLLITREVLAQSGGYLEIAEGKKGGTRVSLFIPAHRAGGE